MRQYQIDINDRGIYPMGLTRTEGGIHVSVAAEAEECSLLLFAGTRNADSSETAGEPVLKLPFPKTGRRGHVWEMTIKGRGLSQYRYAYEADGVRFSDPCGRSFSENSQWGELENAGRLLTAPMALKSFDWGDDQPPRIPYEDCIVYRAHVRGLTKHPASGVRDKGTFRGVKEKIPYLKELGVTTLELLPVAEFQEVMMPESADGNPYGSLKPTGKLNYWGYAPACYYAPKASYAGKGRNPVTELKSLVKALHQEGMELVVELFFTGKEAPASVLEIARFWVHEYHVDGIHFTGSVPAWILEKDPYLAGTKLWATYWGDAGQAGKTSGWQKNLGEYNDGFLVDMRRALKGDEDQLKNLVFRNRRNPAGHGVINYMAATNGFTMMDMVSYDRKHNEANGEDNRDGTDYNYSWNCGEEGPSRKRKLVKLRRQQLRNAYLMLFLSQGTPMLMAGDEFGNSQNGNNNPYCQDNDISWVNWRLKKTNRELFEFVKQVIAFRKEHPVFHMPEEPRVMDYRAVGKPDVSYHGINAWKPEYENFRRQLGILYWGAYGKKPDGSCDDTFFVAYNMHWEPHEFALPHLETGKRWMLTFDTSDGETGGYYGPGQERPLQNEKKHMVPSRSVLVFVGRPDPKTEKKDSISKKPAGKDRKKRTKDQEAEYAQL